MRTESRGRWLMFLFLLSSIIFLRGFDPADAGVGGSDVPTVVGPVQVGGSYEWSFTITNTSTDPNDTHKVKVLAGDGGIFFTTTCGVPHASGICPDDQREVPLTITIDTSSAAGHVGTACEGIRFAVSPTGVPNEYRFEPDQDVILGPSSVGGKEAQCQVDFTVTLNANPLHDSSAQPGLQTSQLARVTGLMDVITNEKGSAAGTSTVTVRLRPTLTTSSDPTEGIVGHILKDRAALSEGWEPTGTITFKLFDVKDPDCNGTPIFTNTVAVDHGNGIYETSSGFPAPVPGTYHWIAQYSGDANNLAASSRCSDEAVLIKCAPTIVTDPNPGAGKVGDLLKDKATLSGGCNPTGTITFKLFWPEDPDCTGTPIFTNVVAVNHGNGDYETSAGFAAAFGGTYHWMAEYSGDINNFPAGSLCSEEPVTIRCVPRISTDPIPKATLDVGAFLRDKATLSEGCDPTGTITFRLFGPEDPNCTGTPIFTNVVAVNHGNGDYETSEGHTATERGTYNWTACYSGDGKNDPVCSLCGEEKVIVGLTLTTRPVPAWGLRGDHLNDCAELRGGIESLSGTIRFALFGVDDRECKAPALFVQDVSVPRDCRYIAEEDFYECCTHDGYRADKVGTFNWTATFTGDVTLGTLCGEEPVRIAPPTDDRCEPIPCIKECPYIGIVGNDIDSKPFYFGCSQEGFLRDQTKSSVPVCWGSFPPVTAQTRVGGAGCEQFRSNKPTDQPEICDITGTPDRGEPNAVVKKQNSGYYEWFIRLPVKPAGAINLVFQCGVLKPNAFTFEGFDSVLVCAAETGERVGTGFCTHDQVPPNVNPIIPSALPRITAIAYPGPYSLGFTPFHLTAYRNPGPYDLTQAKGPTTMSNSTSLYVLDGSTNTRILLKSCMDKTIPTKLPVTGQRNAIGEFEHDLEAGDLIYVRMYIPSNNTVDIYCHSQSLRVSDIGEGGF